ncbi:MAG TPA: Spy/CpxP family protein refolding chaperone [Candidatus Elarobacter sp.]|nr:Spy/CpxP family protein refolding chaperone [Candidatus Elarobacter sp.]
MKLSSLRIAALATAFATVTALYGAVAVGGTVAGSTPAALAQSGGERGRHMGEMFKKLGLSDAQKAQIKAIMKSAREQNQNVTDPEQKRANFKAAFDKINGVLTPAQRDKLKQMRAQMQHDHPQH